MKIAIIFIAACVFMAGAAAQTFNLTVEQFRSAFDAAAKKESNYPDVAATIKTLTKATQTTYRASLNEVPFNRMVKMWKEIDLANGKFVLKDRLELDVGNGNKLSRVSVASSRGDMNLFHFVGTFANTVRVFNPSVSEKQIQDLIAEVGIMSGDDDPQIGRVRSSFTKGAAIACLSQPSQVSLEVVCNFSPRF